MGKKSPLQNLALINFGCSRMLGSVDPSQLQAAALWGSDKDSTNTRGRVAAGRGRSLWLRGVALGRGLQRGQSSSNVQSQETFSAENLGRGRNGGLVAARV